MLAGEDKNLKSLMKAGELKTVSLFATFKYPIADELRRANDIAEQNRLDKLLPTDAVPERPQNQQWILKYNSFENRWQYVPPNAELKYNAPENRWEFVPQ